MDNPKQNKYRKLVIGIVLDGIGMLSFAIPFIGEFSDVVWAGDVPHYAAEIIHLVHHGLAYQFLWELFTCVLVEVLGLEGITNFLFVFPAI